MIPPGLAGFPVWPEHEQTVEVFAALETQWRVVAGLSGAAITGIDYSVITGFFLGTLGVKKRRRKAVVAAIRIMERAALDVFNDRAKETRHADV